MITNVYSVGEKNAVDALATIREMKNKFKPAKKSKDGKPTKLDNTDKESKTVDGGNNN